MRKSTVARFIVCTGLTGGAVWAQVTAPVFEVASIRPASAPPFQAIRGGQVHVGQTIEGTRLDFALTSLWDLLPYAFRVKQYQMSSPTWTHDSRWNILANLPAGSSKHQVPDMMQALLADRFKLTIHREKRDQPVYELTVASGGPKVEVSAGGAVQIWDGSFPGFRFSGGLLHGNAEITGRIMDQPNCGERWEFVPLSMSTFADALTMFLGRPVTEN